MFLHLVLAAKDMLFWQDLGSRLTLWQIGVLLSDDYTVALSHQRDVSSELSAMIEVCCLILHKVLIKHLFH
jgi:hypothetical protein